MVVDVFPIRVSGNDKRIFALGEPHRQFVAHLVGFLGGDLSGAERLPYLIGDYIIFLSAPSGKFVLPLGQHKFFVCGQRAALIAADQLFPVRFVRILPLFLCSAIKRVAAIERPLFLKINWN